MDNEEKENKMYAHLLLNFQGKQKKTDDWISLGKKCKELVEKHKSKKEVAEILGLSRERFREILKFNELPNEVKRLIKNKEISPDATWRIANIKGKKNQIYIAKAIVGLKLSDAREVVYRFRYTPNLDVKEYINKLKSSKNRVEKLSVIILPLKTRTYTKIKESATKEKLSVERFLSNLLDKWNSR